MASITSRPSRPSLKQGNAALSDHAAERIAEAADRYRIVTSDNIDLGSLFALNAGLDQFAKEERFYLGEVDPETTDLEPNALADLQESIAKPIAFQLKTEIPPFKSATAFPKPERLPRVMTDVRSFRSKRK